MGVVPGANFRAHAPVKLSLAFSLATRSGLGDVTSLQQGNQSGVGKNHVEQMTCLGGGEAGKGWKSPNSLKGGRACSLLVQEAQMEMGQPPSLRTVGSPVQISGEGYISSTGGGGVSRHISA